MSELDWLPLEAQTTLTTVSTAASRASFIAGVAYFEAARFGFFGQGDGLSVWYLRLRLAAFVVAIICVAFANSISAQFFHFQTGRSKRLFALSVRFWSLTCYRLFLGAYCLEGLAVAFVGDTYFPSTCGSQVATLNALREANVSSLDDPGSPCQTFFASTMTRWAGVIITVGTVIAIVCTQLQMHPPACLAASKRRAQARTANAKMQRTCSHNGPSENATVATIKCSLSALRRACCVPYTERNTLPRKPVGPARPRKSILVRKLRSVSAINVGTMVVEQCIFVSTFATSALTRALPRGLQGTQDGTETAVGVYMVFTTLAAVSATLATVIVSNVLVYIQAAPVGDLRERFAATATTAVHVGVVLFVVALVSFLVSFSTVGYGTGYSLGHQYVPLGIGCVSILALTTAFAWLGVAICKVRAQKQTAKSTQRDSNGATLLVAARASVQSLDDTETRRCSVASGARSESSGSVDGGLGQNPSNENANHFARLEARMRAVATNASLAVYYTSYNILTYKIEVVDVVQNSRCNEHGGCGSLDPLTPVPVCVGLNYSSPGAGGFSVACNIEAGLGSLSLPFIVFNCLAFGIGLVAVLLGKLLPALGKVFFPRDVESQGRYALAVEWLSVAVVHLFSVVLIFLSVCFGLYGFSKMNPFHYEAVVIGVALLLTTVALVVSVKKKFAIVSSAFPQEQHGNEVEQHPAETEPCDSVDDRPSQASLETEPQCAIEIRSNEVSRRKEQQSVEELDSERSAPYLSRQLARNLARNSTRLKQIDDAQDFPRNSRRRRQLVSAESLSTCTGESSLGLSADGHAKPGQYEAGIGDGEAAPSPAEGACESANSSSDSSDSGGMVFSESSSDESSDQDENEESRQNRQRSLAERPKVRRSICCRWWRPRHLASATGFNDPAVCLIPSVRKAADESVVAVVLESLRTTPDRAVFIGVFAYYGVAYLYGPARAASYPFLALSAFGWGLALLIVVVSTFITVDLTHFLELRSRAAYARSVLETIRMLEDLFLVILVLFLLSFTFIGSIKTGFGVPFEDRYLWISVGAGIFALGFVIPMSVDLAHMARVAREQSSGAKAALLEWVQVGAEQDQTDESVSCDNSSEDENPHSNGTHLRADDTGNSFARRFEAPFSGLATISERPNTASPQPRFMLDCEERENSARDSPCAEMASGASLLCGEAASGVSAEDISTEAAVSRTARTRNAFEAAYIPSRHDAALKEEVAQSFVPNDGTSALHPVILSSPGSPELRFRHRTVSFGSAGSRRTAFSHRSHRSNKSARSGTSKRSGRSNRTTGSGRRSHDSKSLFSGRSKGKSALSSASVRSIVASATRTAVAAANSSFAANQLQTHDAFTEMHSPAADRVDRVDSDSSAASANTRIALVVRDEPVVDTLSSLMDVVSAAVECGESLARQRWRRAARAVRVHPFFTKQLRVAQASRIKAVLLRHNTYVNQAIFIAGNVYIEMVFSDLRSLDDTDGLISTSDAVNAVNWVYLFFVNVSFAAGIAVVASSTVFTVHLRRIVSPAARSRYLRMSRGWVQVIAHALALQVYSWLLGVIFLGLAKHSALEVFNGTCAYEVSQTWTWLNSMAAGVLAVACTFMGIHEIRAIRLAIRISCDLDGFNELLPWFDIAR